MGKGRKNEKKRKAPERNSDSEASLSDGELQVKRKKEADAQDAEYKQRLDRIKAGYTNKQKTLVLSSRGIPTRYRHLMNDLLSLMPHARKDSKLDTKQKLFVINEIADMKDCTNSIFFECRKGSDLFLWFARTPNGPSVKFQVHNVHTMSELNFTGNCLKGSRPFLSFDANFDKKPHTKVMKGLLAQIFGTPKNHPRSRPFIDHVFSFSLLGDKVWFRNFQVAEELNEATKKVEKALVEIGPRFVLDPIRILAGGFSGQVLWDNPEYLTPSAESSIQKFQLRKARERAEKSKAIQEERRAGLYSGPKPLDDVFADSEESENGEYDGSDANSQSGDEESGSENGNGMDVDDGDFSGSDVDESGSEESE